MKKIEELEQKLAELQEEISKLKQQPENKYPMKLVDLGQWRAIGSAPDFNLLKYKLFARLVETCKEWNERDGFKSKWNGKNAIFCIDCSQNKLVVSQNYYISTPLHFQTRETAQLFLETFRTELESVKDLL